MDENHQDKTESQQIATEDKLEIPPLSLKDQRGSSQPQNNQMEDTIKHLREKSRYKVIVEYDESGHPSKFSQEIPPRNWLQLFIRLLAVILIPVAIAVGTAWFSNQQNQTSLQIAQNNRQNDLKIADDQQQEATLKGYLDDMTALLLDKKLGSQAVADKATSAEAAVIARSKTIIALSRLTDPQRKATVVQFLYEAHLIGYLPVCGSNYCSQPVGAIISLHSADLSGVDLSNPTLYGVDLSGADLREAKLSRAKLELAQLVGANLRNAELSNADLYGVDLSNADLRGADLRLADLSYATLSGADLRLANLRGATVMQALLDTAASLQGATMPDGSIHF